MVLIKRKIMKDRVVLPPVNSNILTEAVTERGSLGLLAIGAVGLVAWRKKREEVKALKTTNSK